MYTYLILALCKVVYDLEYLCPSDIGACLMQAKSAAFRAFSVAPVIAALSAFYVEDGGEQLHTAFIQVGV